MPKQREVLQIHPFLGLNMNSDTAIKPNEIRDGKNFTIGYDGFIERSKGSEVAFSDTDYSIDKASEVYTHDDITDFILVLGEDSSGVPQTKMYSKSTWFDMYYAQTLQEDADAAAETIKVGFAGKLNYLSTMRIIDDTGATESITILSTNNDTVTLSSPLANEYKIAKNARVESLDSDESDLIIYNNQSNQFVSYLKTPMWASGRDVFFLTNVRNKTGDTINGYYVQSLNDANRAFFLAGGGDPIEGYSPIRGTSMAVKDNRLFLAGEGEFANSLMFSQRFSTFFYDIGTGNLPFLQYLPIGGDNTGSGSVEDSITKIIGFQDDLIVFKNRSIHRLTGRTFLQFDSIQLTDSIGCDSPDTVISCKDGIRFRNGKDIWLYNGQFTNLSIPRVSKILTNRTNKKMSAGYLDDRYYIINVGSSLMLRYDVDNEVWSKEDVAYHKFDSLSKSSLAINSDRDKILSLDKGLVREDSDEYDFEVELPYVDANSKSIEKRWYEVNLAVRTAEKSFPIEISIDGRQSVVLPNNFNPRPIYREANYGGPTANPSEKYEASTYSTIPLYHLVYQLPLENLGYKMSVSIKITKPASDIRIESINIYLRTLGRFGEEKL